MDTQLIGNICLIKPRGPMLSDVVDEVKSSLAYRYNTGITRFILDLSEVDLISSAGLGLLFLANKVMETKDCVLIVLSPQPRVLQAIKIWRLDRVLVMFDDLQDAIDFANKKQVSMV